MDVHRHLRKWPSGRRGRRSKSGPPDYKGPGRPAYFRFLRPEQTDLPALVDLEWEEVTTRLLPATDLTIAGIVKHLAWAEDRWFQNRLLGVPMPAPRDAPGADDPDQAMRLASDDTVAGIAQLYASACSRSRSALARCDSLDHIAAVPSFGTGPPVW